MIFKIVDGKLKQQKIRDDFNWLAERNEVIFSAKGQLASFARACQAYFFYAPKVKAGAVAHVDCNYLFDGKLHSKALDAALMTIRSISRGGEIKAFFWCGNIHFMRFMDGKTLHEIEEGYKVRKHDAKEIAERNGIRPYICRPDHESKIQFLDLATGVFRLWKEIEFRKGYEG